MNLLILMIMMMFFMFLMCLMISMIIMKISIFFSKKMKMNFEKMSPFECGFNPIYFKRMPFSIRFFLISIIFLIFDVEIALMMPMIISFNLSNINIWFLTSIFIFLILFIGLMHEWNHGSLNWL